jgi:hypothetical protein
MGATTFHTETKAKTAKEAFTKLVADAEWTHGHGGYTGTIAEKQGFTEFKRPKGVRESTCHMVIQALSKVNPTHTIKLEKTYPKWPIKQMVKTFEDKWGPAVCVETRPNNYFFCGWASC